MYTELLMGCGHKRDKRIWIPGTPTAWQKLTTLDHDRYCKPDLLCDLHQIPWAVLSGSGDPFEAHVPEQIQDESFNEVHAYEVLEHLGRQGHVESFFATFNEIGRILKVGGYLAATVPSRYSPWLWGDPGHARVILPQSLVFLSRANYDAQIGNTSMSDYRDLLLTDWEPIRSEDDKTLHRFILKKKS